MRLKESNELSRRKNKKIVLFGKLSEKKYIKEEGMIKN